MSYKDFTTSIIVSQSPAEVFNAINDPGAWWQGNITGDTNKLGNEFTYSMEPHHLTRQKIVELKPDERVVWLVTESKINYVHDRNEWLNTKIIFEIERLDNRTKLTFTHQGLQPAIECYGGCSSAWTKLIEQSLYSLITTGKGVNIF